MTETLTAKADRLYEGMLNLGQTNTAALDALEHEWDISVPLVVLIHRGYVRTVTADGRNALDEFDAALTEALAKCVLSRVHGGEEWCDTHDSAAPCPHAS